MNFILLLTMGVVDAFPVTIPFDSLTLCQQAGLDLKKDVTLHVQNAICIKVK